MNSTPVPSRARACQGLRTGGRPLTFALVDTSAPPNTRHSAALSVCAVWRRAMVSWRPVSHAGVSGAAGSSQVSGAGQLRIARV